MANNVKEKKNDLDVIGFWKAQQPAWKITVYRTSMERLVYKAVLPYLTLYIVLMGATNVSAWYRCSAGWLPCSVAGTYLAGCCTGYVPPHNGWYTGRPVLCKHLW